MEILNFPAILVLTLLGNRIKTKYLGSDLVPGCSLEFELAIKTLRKLSWVSVADSTGPPVLGACCEEYSLTAAQACQEMLPDLKHFEPHLILLL